MKQSSLTSAIAEFSPSAERKSRPFRLRTGYHNLISPNSADALRMADICAILIKAGRPPFADRIDAVYLHRGYRDDFLALSPPPFCMIRT